MVESLAVGGSLRSAVGRGGAVSEGWLRGLTAGVLAIARSEGLRASDAVVIRDRMNVLVKLEPFPVVARVQTVSAEVRPAWNVQDRAVRVASRLDSLGAPVAGPTTEVAPGPHVHGALVVSFWKHWEHTQDGPFDAIEAGRRLREIHDALVHIGETIPPRDTAEELDRLINLAHASKHVGLLMRAREALSWSEEHEPRYQVIHGDAHLGNVLRTPQGPIWCDWEMVGHGARENDLAALVMHGAFPARYELFARQARDALVGYGAGDLDPRALNGAVDKASLLQLAWWVLIELRRPGSVRPEWIDGRARWWESRLSVPPTSVPVDGLVSTLITSWSR